MNIKINSARTAAVAQDHFWIDIKRVPPPAGVKLLLIEHFAQHTRVLALRDGVEHFSAEQNALHAMS